MKRYIIYILIIIMCIGTVFSAVESKGNDDLLFVDDNQQSYTNCSDFGDDFWCGTYDDWTTGCNYQGVIEEPSPGCNVGLDDEYGYCISCDLAEAEEYSSSCADMTENSYCSVSDDFSEESFLESSNDINSAEECSTWCDSVDETFNCCSYVEAQEDGETIKLCGAYKDSSSKDIELSEDVNLDDINICSKEINKKEVCSDIDNKNECSAQSHCQAKSGIVFLWNIFPWWGFKECVDKDMTPPVDEPIDGGDGSSDTPVVSTKVAKINTINKINLEDSEVLKSYNLDYDVVYRITYDIKDYNDCYLSGDNNAFFYYTSTTSSSHVPLLASENSVDILITSDQAQKTDNLYLNCDGSEKLDTKSLSNPLGDIPDACIMSGKDLTYSVLKSTELELSSGMIEALSIRLQEMIDDGTYSNLAAAVALSGASPTINDATEIKELIGVIEKNKHLIEASPNCDISNIEFPPIGSIEVSDCIDSDGGLNYFEKGTVIDKDNNQKTDYCAGNVALVEYSCADNGLVTGNTYVCKNGCVKGESICNPEEGSNIDIPEDEETDEDEIDLQVAICYKNKDKEGFIIYKSSSVDKTEYDSWMNNVNQKSMIPVCDSADSKSVIWYNEDGTYSHTYDNPWYGKSDAEIRDNSDGSIDNGVTAICYGFHNSEGLSDEIEYKVADADEDAYFYWKRNVGKGWIPLCYSDMRYVEWLFIDDNLRGNSKVMASTRNPWDESNFIEDGTAICYTDKDKSGEFEYKIRKAHRETYGFWNTFHNKFFERKFNQQISGDYFPVCKTKFSEYVEWYDDEGNFIIITQNPWYHDDYDKDDSYNGIDDSDLNNRNHKETGDSGLDYYTKGYHTSNNQPPLYDYCDNGYTLREYYIKDIRGKPESKGVWFNCPDGCKDGACIKGDDDSVDEGDDVEIVDEEGTGNDDSEADDGEDTNNNDDEIPETIPAKIMKTNEEIDCGYDSYPYPQGTVSKYLYKKIGLRCPEASGVEYWANLYDGWNFEFQHAYADYCNIDSYLSGENAPTAPFDNRGWTSAEKDEIQECNNELLCPEGYEYVPNTEYCRLK